MPRKPTPQFADRWVEQEEASDILEISPKGLEQDRYVGVLGIPYYKFGTRVRYRLSELIQWAEARRVTPPGAIDRPELPRRGAV
jgi:hypothetical protein